MLETALIKLGQRARKSTVLRGVRGKMPPIFEKMYAEGRKLKRGEVILDPGFMSTTMQLSVATSPTYKGAALFFITGRSPRPGVLRSGAPVSWVSQFPNEQEVLFPAYSELWYAMPDKRDPKLHEKFRHLKGTAVYQFGVRYFYNQEHQCPNLPAQTCKLAL